MNKPKREAFEKWLAKDMQDEKPLSKRGKYLDPEVHFMWEGFQAGFQASAQASSPEGVAMFGVMDSADFEANTITFAMDPGYFAAAGRYEIRRTDALPENAVNNGDLDVFTQEEAQALRNCKALLDSLVEFDGVVDGELFNAAYDAVENALSAQREEVKS